jgi:hypothetical protein
MERVVLNALEKRLSRRVVAACDATQSEFLRLRRLPIVLRTRRSTLKRNIATGDEDESENERGERAIDQH